MGGLSIERSLGGDLPSTSVAGLSGWLLYMPDFKKSPSLKGDDPVLFHDVPAPISCCSTCSHSLQYTIIGKNTTKFGYFSGAIPPMDTTHGYHPLLGPHASPLAPRRRQSMPRMGDGIFMRAAAAAAQKSTTTPFFHETQNLQMNDNQEYLIIIQF